MSNIAKIEKLAQKKKSDKLIKFLNSKDKEERIAAINALGKVNDEDSYNKLIALLSSQDTDERIAAAISLGQTSKDSAITHMNYHISKQTDAKVKEAMTAAIVSIKKNIDSIHNED